MAESRTDRDGPEVIPDAELLGLLARVGLNGRLAGERRRAPVPGRDRYEVRLEYELRTLAQHGHAGLMLAIADGVEEARRAGIPIGPGRGRALNSLVAFSLGITGLDPVALDLPFESFLNPDRPVTPHLAVDVGAQGCDRVRAFVRSRWGDDCAARFVGLPVLDALARGLEALRARGCTGLRLETLPADDPGVWDRIARGETQGIFGLDSPGMRDLLQRARPGCLDHLAALLAMDRPGPRETGRTERLVALLAGPMANAHPVDGLSAILRDSCGMPIWREQTMHAALRLAGFPYARADLLQRALARKDPAEVPGWRAAFLHGALGRDLSREAAERVFDLLAREAEFQVSKGPFLALAMLACWQAYLPA